MSLISRTCGLKILSFPEPVPVTYCSYTWQTQLPTLREHRPQCPNYFITKERNTLVLTILYSAKLQHAKVSTLNMCISFSSCLQKLLILKQEFLTVMKQWWFSPVTIGFAFWGVCVVPFGVSSNKVRTANDSSLKILSPLIGKMAAWVPIWP